MKILLKFSFILIFLGLILQQCSDATNKPEPPARVELVPKTADTLAVEHGIDAVPESNSIFLEWHPNQEKTLAGYAVYRSETPDKNFAQVKKIASAAGGKDTTYVDSVALNMRFYYFVRAYDTEDQYGDPSDTVNYKLMEKAELLAPVGPSANPNPVFQWNFGPSGAPSFIFRLEKLIGNNRYGTLLTDSHSPTYNNPESWQLSLLGYPQPLTSGEYRWRIDVDAGNNFGSESNWKTFTVQ